MSGEKQKFIPKGEDGQPVGMNKYLDIKNKKMLQGTKYDHIGSRKGLGSMLDGELIEENIKRANRLMGSGYVRFKRIDGGAGKPININGMVVYPTGAGNDEYSIVDGVVLNEAAKREREKRAYIEKLCEEASLSDEICAMILSIDVEELEKLLGTGGTCGLASLDPDLTKTNGMPSAISTYAESTQLYSWAVQKLRILIADRFPVISEDLTNKETLKHGDEKL